MRLRIKNLKWIAGAPVVILNDKTAQKLNVFENERVCLNDGIEYNAEVDIFPKLVKENEIGLSKEVSDILKHKEGDYLQVSASLLPSSSKLIKKKMDGKRLTVEEIDIIIEDIVRNKLTRPEIAFFVAAQRVYGMTMNELIGLVDSMVKKGGTKLSFKDKKVIDKHCIGGVAGNRTTPIVVSICACAGLVFPKTSSRAITSAAGTADVIETLSNLDMSVDYLKKVITKNGGCFAWGGSINLAPSDEKIIQIERLIDLDVESQMIASIMSKKISAGAKIVLIDIPYGKGGKVSSIFKAMKIAKKFKKVGSYFGMKVDCVYTNGTQPIGKGIGPVFEMVDVLSVLKNDEDAPKDLKEKSLVLASRLMEMAGIKNAKRRAREILESGQAYEKFKNIINSQNGKNDFKERLKKLIPAKFSLKIRARKNGKIKLINNNDINKICRILGTPETKNAGVYLTKHLGKVKKGEVIMILYSENKKKLEKAKDYFESEEVVRIV